MAATRKSAEARRPKRPPATTLEGREKQMVALAVDLAEKQLANGTASSQVITHFLKLATTREQLEQQKIALETELLKAKQDQLLSSQRTEELYENAIRAMRSYSGHEEEDDYED